jgi:hypothetical protein
VIVAARAAFVRRRGWTAVPHRTSAAACHTRNGSSSHRTERRFPRLRSALTRLDDLSRTQAAPDPGTCGLRRTDCPRPTWRVTTVAKPSWGSLDCSRMNRVSAISVAPAAMVSFSRRGRLSPCAPVTGQRVRVPAGTACAPVLPRR